MQESRSFRRDLSKSARLSKPSSSSASRVQIAPTLRRALPAILLAVTAPANMRRLLAAILIVSSAVVNAQRQLDDNVAHNLDTSKLVLGSYKEYQFAVPPGKGAKDGHGGLFTLSLKQAARVGIALDGPAWVDVITGTQAIASVEHGHGPACSGIRKIVWFALPAGRHLVQIAGSKAADVRVMAADALANQPQ